MNPLLLFAGSILPSILDLLAGKRAASVSKAVIDAITDTAGTSDPAQVQTKIAQNPQLSADLRIELARIVADEKKAEQKAASEEREYALRNTGGARDFQIDLLDKDPYVSRTPMILSYIVTAGFFLILCLFVFLKNRLEAPLPVQFSTETLPILNTLRPEQIAALVQPRSDFVIQIINIGIGALSAAFATVISYWLGSSQGSRRKDALVSDLQERAADTQERQAKSNAVMVERVTATVSQLPAPIRTDTGGADSAPPVADVPPSTVKPSDPVSEPAKPAPAGLLGEVLPELVRPHRQFPNGVSWAITAAGVAIDGARAAGTAGPPSTVRRIWADFGSLCVVSAKKYGVPVELIVATIATESGGDPNARRAEPAIGDESVGLMQTLVKTARFATGQTNLRASDLLDPLTSIDAGTAYIASQRGSTHFDPPRVAAAYNAGSLKRDDADANRWKLHCFPRGTGQHIDRFVAWFNDATKVSDEQDWGQANGCPSFVLALVSMTSSTLVVDPTSADFPPRPPFRPILSDREREKLFGAFQFVADPLPDNRENIRILGDWEAKNIVKVEIPLQIVLGRPGPLIMHFHANAKDQLVACWLAWEKAGLLDRILTYDGAFVPRFQRKSTTKLSNHAFGSAFDINARWNPLAAEPADIGEKGCVRELVPIANAHGFYWGGHFSTRPDGMHFEVAKLQPS